jgi:hypothetical protein
MPIRCWDGLRLSLSAMDGNTMRRNTTLLTGLAITIAMIGGMSTASSAFAMGCLNPNLEQKSLAQDVTPFDQSVYDKVAKLGNHCAGTTQQVKSSTANMTVPVAAPLAKAKPKTPKY